MQKGKKKSKTANRFFLKCAIYFSDVNSHTECGWFKNLKGGVCQKIKSGTQL